MLARLLAGNLVLIALWLLWGLLLWYVNITSKVCYGLGFDLGQRHGLVLRGLGLVSG